MLENGHEFIPEKPVLCRGQVDGLLLGGGRIFLLYFSRNGGHEDVDVVSGSTGQHDSLPLHMDGQRGTECMERGQERWQSSRGGYGREVPLRFSTPTNRTREELMDVWIEGPSGGKREI
jgi:hypothetical protein